MLYAFYIILMNDGGSPKISGRGIVDQSERSARMISTFTARRAVGKAIMATLVLDGVPFGRTHDRVELGDRAEEAVPDLPFAIERLIRLDPHAVVFRYGEPAVDLLEPEEGDEVVASVVDRANARIRGMADRERGAAGGPPRTAAQVDGMRPACRGPVLRRQASGRSFECPDPPIARVSRGCSSDGEPLRTSDDAGPARPLAPGPPARVPRAAAGACRPPTVDPEADVGPSERPPPAFPSGAGSPQEIGVYLSISKYTMVYGDQHDDQTGKGDEGQP